jgi:hypothetical protein
MVHRFRNILLFHTTINILGWFFPIIDAILLYLSQHEKCIIKSSTMKL